MNSLENSDSRDNIESIELIRLTEKCDIIKYMFIWVEEYKQYNVLLQLYLKFSGMYDGSEFDESKANASLLLLRDSPNFHMIQDALNHIQRNDLTVVPFEIYCRRTKYYVDYFQKPRNNQIRKN